MEKKVAEIKRVSMGKSFAKTQIERNKYKQLTTENDQNIKMQSSLTQFNSHNIVQVFLQGKDTYEFITRPLIGQRKVPLVSRQH